MKKYLITFRSITLAQRGEKLMRRHDSRCQVRRTPRWMEKQGCGYGLEVRLADLKEGLSALEEQGIPYRKAYFLSQDGTAQELEL